jgi:flagellar biosynthesis GTPase FlhF
MPRYDLTKTTRQKTGQKTGQTTGQTTRHDISDKEHLNNLTKFRASLKQHFAATTHEEQEKAQQELNEQAEKLYEKKRQEGEQADSERWARRERKEREDNYQKLLRRTQRTFVEQMAHSTMKKVPRFFGYDGVGGSQSKEILGKQRRIYKVAGSRKEHVKYKGQLIPVSDYKKLMKLKR